MSFPVLKVAVIGHTNTGKTSLLRTLTRDVTFGEVSSRPATTRIVEGSTLFIGDVPALDLIDTPGLESSTELHERLDTIRRAAGSDWTDAILSFVEDPRHNDGFLQEAKALRQVIECDVALYVIDARDRVLGKHRDELDILGRCARPIVPVLNFVADAEARSDVWQRELARVNMHVVAHFDTVVFDEVGELQLFQKLHHLLDRFGETLDAVIAETSRRRDSLRGASANLIADLLIDVASYSVTVPERENTKSSAALTEIQRKVREREQRCVDALLGLFRFRSGDYLSETLPIVDGEWGLDLFSPQSLIEFGAATTEGVATGALAGLAVDAMVGGLSLGTGTAAGAIVGGLIGAVQSRGRRVIDGLRGYTNLHVEEATLDVLATRQLRLVRALLRRGHASQDRIRLEAIDRETDAASVAKRLHPALTEARRCPEWSRLGQPGASVMDARREAAGERLAAVLVEAITRTNGPTDSTRTH